MLQAVLFGTGFDDESFRVFISGIVQCFANINTTFGKPFDNALRYCLNQANRGSPFALMMWKNREVLNGIKLSNGNFCRVAYGNLGTAAQSSQINAPKRLSKLINRSLFM